MILVDTPIWIDHLHKREPQLVELLDISACSQVGVALFEARP